MRQSLRKSITAFRALTQNQQLVLALMSYFCNKGSNSYSNVTFRLIFPLTQKCGVTELMVSLYINLSSSPIKYYHQVNFLCHIKIILLLGYFFVFECKFRNLCCNQQSSYSYMTLTAQYYSIEDHYFIIVEQNRINCDIMIRYWMNIMISVFVL